MAELWWTGQNNCILCIVGLSGMYLRTLDVKMFYVVKDFAEIICLYYEFICIIKIDWSEYLISPS